MSFGEDYAKAYDALYRAKDYPAEARFVMDRLGNGPKTILNIGCGTGMHDVELVTAGHDVTGIDMSQQMLKVAAGRRDALPADAQARLAFQAGDARTLQLGRKFDAVISLFHVMSYMAGDGDFAAALKTTRSHLNPGGILLFDFWYGPAVVADPPQAREKVVEEDGKRIRRVTTPHVDRGRDTVRIVFDMQESDGAGNQTATVREEHVMRYFFEAGIEKDLSDAGFEMLETGEWLTGAVPGPASFGVYALARAK